MRYRVKWHPLLLFINKSNIEEHFCTPKTQFVPFKTMTYEITHIHEITIYVKNIYLQLTEVGITLKGNSSRHVYGITHPGGIQQARNIDTEG